MTIWWTIFSKTFLVNLSVWQLCLKFQLAFLDCLKTLFSKSIKTSSTSSRSKLICSCLGKLQTGDPTSNQNSSHTALEAIINANKTNTFLFKYCVSSTRWLNLRIHTCAAWTIASLNMYFRSTTNNTDDKVFVFILHQYKSSRYLLVNATDNYTKILVFIDWNICISTLNPDFRFYSFSVV